MSAPLVSVILPSYARGPALAVSAGSVLAQTYRDLELIIVDDCSEPSLEPYVSALSDPRVRYLRRSVRGGPSAARNTGLEAARGEYIAFQDSDDEWLLDKLSSQVDALVNSQENTFLLGSVVRLIGKNVITYKPGGASGVPVSLNFSQIAHRRTTYTQGWLVPRHMLEAVGGFDENLHVWEDYELLLRLAAEFQAVAFPDVVALSVRVEDSITQDRSLFASSMCYIVDKHASMLSHGSELWGKLNYTCGRLLMATDDSTWPRARAYLKRAIAADTTRMSYWRLLLASYFAPRKLNRYLENLN